MKRSFFIVITIVLIFCVLSVSRIGFFEFMELKALDVQFTARGALKPVSNIIIAGIDEASLKKLGQWPWTRDKLSLLVQHLREAGAKVIAFDIVFAEADRGGGDALFVEELKKTKGIVLGYSDVKDGKVSNIPIIAKAGTEAYLNTYPDRDGIVRRTPLVNETFGGRAFSFALTAVSKFLGFTPIVKSDSAGNPIKIVIGEKIVPVDPLGRMMIVYLSGPKTFQYVSAVDIIDNSFVKEKFKDSIVLVGADAAGLSDIRPVPLSAVYPGVEIHATVIDNILTGRYLKRDVLSEISGILTLVFIGALSLILFSRAKILLSVIFETTLVCAICLSGYLFFINGIWIPIVYQVMESLALFTGIMLFRYFTEGREKRRIHEAFKHYLAPEVIEGLLKDSGKLKLWGEKREITILFSDVRDFTTISENLDPERLVSMMNEYFTKMTDIIMKEGGMVDKYIGDAIMAFFGAPAEQKDHAERACKAALNMQKEVNALEADFVRRFGLKKFKIGVGINTGVAYVGNMGSSQRFNYTAIGDSVNVASRLEGLTKTYNVPIIVSSATKNSSQASFNFSLLGLAQVKGKAKEIEVFALT